MTQSNGRLEKALLGTKDTNQLTALMNPCHAPFENQILESTGRGSLKSNHDSPSCNDLYQPEMSQKSHVPPYMLVNATKLVISAWVSIGSTQRKSKNVPNQGGKFPFRKLGVNPKNF